MGGKGLIHEPNWRELDGLLADCDDPGHRLELLAEIKAVRGRWAAELERRAQALALRKSKHFPDTVRVCRKCGVEGPHRTLRGAGKVWTKGTKTVVLPALVVSQCRECDARASAAWRDLNKFTTQDERIAAGGRVVRRRGKKKDIFAKWPHLSLSTREGMA